jgi:hypothetical protein
MVPFDYGSYYYYYYYYHHLIELHMGILPDGSGTTIRHNTKIHTTLRQNTAHITHSECKAKKQSYPRSRPWRVGRCEDGTKLSMYATHWESHKVLPWEVQASRHTPVWILDRMRLFPFVAMNRRTTTGPALFAPGACWDNDKISPIKYSYLGVFASDLVTRRRRPVLYCESGLCLSFLCLVR